MIFKFLFELKFVSNKFNVFVLKILPNFRKMCKRLPFSQIHSCKRNKGEGLEGEGRSCKGTAAED
jgi:hypothetical protein